MNELNWKVCESCTGIGKRKRKISKKAKFEYLEAYAFYLKNSLTTKQPIAPKSSWIICTNCDGAGIIKSSNITEPNFDQFPNIAIIGLGIGGISLAIACLHRGIPFTIYERDAAFDTRSQGYGLTLQQASKALKHLGITNLKEGIVSTKHLVFDLDKNVLGEWGIRKWMPNAKNPKNKQTNIHIARQSLRLQLLEQLPSDAFVRWNHQLIDFNIDSSKKPTLNFLVNGEVKKVTADLIVGADGIRSKVRQHLFYAETKPLRYLGCMVILGICCLENLKYLNCELLDSATVFQTANGKERIYLMPYAKDKIMWQFSFPISEKKGKELSLKGSNAMKETVQQINWHTPISDILRETCPSLITGYPVYDRSVLTSELEDMNQPVTLIGDAAHPMSPFKGQGANQAILDGISLANILYKKNKSKKIEGSDLRISILNSFEEEMMERVSVKITESAEAAKFLHSKDVLKVTDQPRRSYTKKT